MARSAFRAWRRSLPAGAGRRSSQSRMCPPTAGVLGLVVETTAGVCDWQLCGGHLLTLTSGFPRVYLTCTWLC